MQTEHPLKRCCSGRYIALQCPLIRTHEGDEQVDYLLDMDGIAEAMNLDAGQIIPLVMAGGGFLLSRPEGLEVQYKSTLDQLFSLAELVPDLQGALLVTHEGCGYRCLKMGLGGQKHPGVNDLKLAKDNLTREVSRKPRLASMAIRTLYAELRSGKIRYHETGS